MHLSAFGMRKSYRKGKNEVSVLNGVDLAVERGEMVSVVGSSGSGKSTLLHLLGLLDQADKGLVVLEERRIDNLPEKKRDELRNRVFGFIFQSYHLLPELSAIENVMAPQMIRHGLFSYLRSRKALENQAAEVLDRVGLGHRLHHKPNELSGGEMQRTAIARALAANPEIILADEPTGNLDGSTGQGIMDLLRDLNRERGITMVLVTHDMNIAQQTNRIVRLAQGRIEDWNPSPSPLPLPESIASSSTLSWSKGPNVEEPSLAASATSPYAGAAVG